MMDFTKHELRNRLEEAERQLEKYRNRVSVGTAVMVRRGSMVIMGKRKGAHGEGTWHFPGGRMEKGENMKESAARELHEETNIVTAPSWLRLAHHNDTYHADRDAHWATFFFELWVDSEIEPQLMEPDKCERWEWVYADGLPSPLFEPVELLPSLIGL